MNQIIAGSSQVVITGWHGLPHSLSTTLDKLYNLVFIKLSRILGSLKSKLLCTVVLSTFSFGAINTFIAILYFESLIATGPAKGIFSNPRNYPKVYN